MKNKVHWEEIKKIAIAHQLEELDNTDALLRFLKFWWCKTYNRPFKDPLLMSYTADELSYEFLRYFYAEPKNDPRKKMEQEQSAKDDEAWIAKMLSEVKKQPIEEKASPKPEEKDNSPEDLPDPKDFPDISAKFDPNT